MADQPIIDRLRVIMARNSPTPTDGRDIGEAHSLAALGIDSLAMLDCIYDIQQEFRIQFDPQDLAQVTTVAQLAGFIAARAGA